MLVYGIMIATAMICTYFSYKAEKKATKIVLFCVAALSFIVVSGLRYDVGTDYFYRYVPNYNTFANGGTISSLEILFVGLVGFCLLVTKEYYLLFFVTSTIIIGLTFLGIYKNSKSILISVLVFFVGSFFFQSMNLVRQFIAMAILFSTYKLMFNKKTLPLWGIYVIVAILFHSMSIVYLIALLLYKKVIDYRVVMALAIIILLFFGPIIDFTLNLTAKSNNPNIVKYQHYVRFEGSMPWSSLLVETGIYVFMMLSYMNAEKNGKKLDNQGVFFLNCQAIAILFILMNQHIEVFFRVALVFSFFQILSIPYFIKLNNECELKLFGDRKIFKMKNGYLAKNYVIISSILVLLLLTSRMIYANFIKGAEEVFPYKSIFTEQKNK